MSSGATDMSSTAVQHNDSSVESGHIAAIIVCMLIGLIALCYVIYRLTQRYCPNMLLAITPQDNARPLARLSSDDSQQCEYERQAAEMAAHMAADDNAEQGKKSDSHVLDMAGAASPLSINEQWTIRDAPAEDEDVA